MQQMYQCPGCNAIVNFGAKFCANCGMPLNWQPIQSQPVNQQWRHSGVTQRQEIFTPNQSGQGTAAYIPTEIKHWNWGAFIFGWIWGIGNNVWIALICLIPYVGIIMAFVLGAKGNEWAWQKKRWDSIEHFQRTQRTWMKWGIGLAIIYFVIITLGIFVWIMDTFSGQILTVPSSMY
ncbi:MAG: zinc ribbon domain-containing protein [Chloroflexi bacterium]|nr:zinc ribbon domain-containing protein [Chloroflexota bacterium]